ncbi:MAG: c-type cytochrome [Dehalococcoidia bacterium]|nr:c-type cytochrome [Dehalococcoidia bacterium]
MNTGKQVNVMIGLLFISFVLFGGYFVNEQRREVDARREVTERNANRGARLFVQNCRTCHGLEGWGAEEGGVGAKLNSPAFLILGEGNRYGLAPTSPAEADGIRSFLFSTISCGRSNTFMPPWSQHFGGPLSDTQVNHVVTMITNGRWDLVAEESAHADEGLTAQQVAAIVVKDPATLAVTSNNCGQFASETAQSFRMRDPFSATPAAPAAAGTPVATATQGPPPAGSRLNEVTLSDAPYGIKMGAATLDAGLATFRVANKGVIAHEFVVTQSGAAIDALPQAGGAVDEKQLKVLGRIAQLPAGQTKDLTLTLAAGKYSLICNLPGHYQLGMRVALTVQ